MQLLDRYANLGLSSKSRIKLSLLVGLGVEIFEYLQKYYEGNSISAMENWRQNVKPDIHLAHEMKLIDIAQEGFAGSWPTVRFMMKIQERKVIDSPRLKFENAKLFVVEFDRSKQGSLL